MSAVQRRFQQRNGRCLDFLLNDVHRGDTSLISLTPRSGELAPSSGWFRCAGRDASTAVDMPLERTGQLKDGESNLDVFKACINWDSRMGGLLQRPEQLSSLRLHGYNAAAEVWGEAPQLQAPLSRRAVIPNDARGMLALRDPPPSSTPARRPRTGSPLRLITRSCLSVGSSTHEYL